MIKYVILQFAALHHAFALTMESNSLKQPLFGSSLEQNQASKVEKGYFHIADEHERLKIKFEIIFTHQHDNFKVKNGSHYINGITVDGLKSHFKPKDLPKDVEDGFKKVATKLSNREVEEGNAFMPKGTLYLTKDQFKNEFVTWACENNMQAVFDEEFLSFTEFFDHDDTKKWYKIDHDDIEQWKALQSYKATHNPLEKHMTAEGGYKGRYRTEAEAQAHAKAQADADSADVEVRISALKFLEKEQKVMLAEEEAQEADAKETQAYWDIDTHEEVAKAQENEAEIKQALKELKEKEAEVLSGKQAEKKATAEDGGSALKSFEEEQQDLVAQDEAREAALRKAQALGADEAEALAAVQEKMEKDKKVLNQTKQAEEALAGKKSGKQSHGEVAPEPEESQEPVVGIIEDERARVQKKFSELFKLFNEYQYVDGQIGLVHCFTDESLKKFFSPEDVPEDVQLRFNTVALPNQHHNSKILIVF